MARRHVMTARRKVALRKAQLASAKKRSRRRKVAIGVGTAAVLGTAIVGYRSYDRKVERNQRTYLLNKAINVRLAKLPMLRDENGHIYGGGHQVLQQEIFKQSKIPRQPRRYRSRPSSIQTKRAIRQNRQKVLGKRVGGAMNAFGKGINTPNPIRVTHSVRKNFYGKSGLSVGRSPMMKHGVLIKVRKANVALGVNKKSSWQMFESGMG